jgi:hypothetical protein
MFENKQKEIWKEDKLKLEEKSKLNKYCTNVLDKRKRIQIKLKTFPNSHFPSSSRGNDW